MRKLRFPQVDRLYRWTNPCLTTGLVVITASLGCAPSANVSQTSTSGSSAVQSPSRQLEPPSGAEDSANETGTSPSVSAAPTTRETTSKSSVAEPVPSEKRNTQPSPFSLDLGQPSPEAKKDPVGAVAEASKAAMAKGDNHLAVPRTEATISTASAQSSLSIEPQGDQESLADEGAKREKVKIRFSSDAVEARVKAEPASVATHSDDQSPKSSRDIASSDKRLASPTTGAQSATNKGAGDKPSSIVVATAEEKNQKIAEGWPVPWATIFITGQQYGYMEPCGCTGLENQKGGLNRRDTLLTQIRSRGWEVLPIDVGNQVRRAGMGIQSDIKFQLTSEAFKTMEYAAVGFGEDDLNLSSDQLIHGLLNNPGDKKSPFVSANVVIGSPDFMERFKILTVGNKKIGVTAILGDAMRAKWLKVQQGGKSDIQLSPVYESLKGVTQEMAKAKLDFTVLIAHTDMEDAYKLAKSFPEFSLVLTGGYGEPEYRPAIVEGTKTMLIQSGVKGMYVGLLGLYEDAQQPIRYQRIALSSQFPDSPRMLAQFATYQKSLKDRGLGRLAIRALSHSSGHEYLGTEKCGECHTKAYEIWKGTPHAHSTESLIHPPERKEIERHFDPECLSCHVTGWNPQGFYPYHTGYLSLKETPLMTQNGCENCHGPGSAHVAAEEEGTNATLMAKLREEMQLPLADGKAEQKCKECHDMDNSPAFHENGAFEKYWEQVKHLGKD